MNRLSSTRALRKNALVAAIACLMLAGPGILSLDRRRARAAAALKVRKARLKAGRV